MAHEILVALDVTDEEEYRTYRLRMTPILESYGGRFAYDFRVSEVLKSDSEEPINRVFTIRFPDPDARRRFFADPEYLKVREEHFVPSAGGARVIGEWQT
ncbi:MAG: DUF1330 domain-containing protein [Gemmatimonadota bacterium]